MKKTRTTFLLSLILVSGVTMTSAMARAAGASEFVEGGFYTITNNSVGGKDLGLTYILPKADDVNPAAMTNYMSTSAVELQKIEKNEKRQLWQFKHEEISTPHSYSIWLKYSDKDDQLTGTLRVINTDNAFSEDKKYQMKYNQTRVGPYWNETEGYWVVTKLPGGKFRLMSLKGIEIKKAREKPYPSTWNESRSLEAYKMADGKVGVRHAITKDVPSQMWTITKVAQRKISG